jgi:hypothetical protein
MIKLMKMRWGGMWTCREHLNNKIMLLWMVKDWLWASGSGQGPLVISGRWCGNFRLCFKRLLFFFFSQKFFQPAVDNIKNNLGASSVSEEHVREVCRQILEDAKQMYCSNSQSRGSSPFNELSDSETGSIWECRFGRPNTQVICCLL